MPNGSEPLTQADLERINSSLKSLDDADSIIERAKRAGIPLDEQEKESRDSRAQLLRIKQTFFPGQ